MYFVYKQVCITNNKINTNRFTERTIFMLQNINLKKLEKKAWISTFQDGLWDIMLGLVFFIPAVIGLLGGNDYVLIPLYFVSILLFVTAKKRIIVPRMGLVKFGEKRRKKSHVIAMILTVSVVFLIFMVVMKKSGLLSEAVGIPTGSIIVGINILVVFGLMAYFLNFDRLYLYAVLVGAVEPVSAVLEIKNLIESPYLIMLVISGGMIITGIILLVRFIRKYPLTENEA